VFWQSFGDNFESVSVRLSNWELQGVTLTLVSNQLVKC